MDEVRTTFECLSYSDQLDIRENSPFFLNIYFKLNYAFFGLSKYFTAM